MARSLWQRIRERLARETVDRYVDQHRGSAADRRVATESLEDYSSDEVAAERLGGIEPTRLEDEDLR